MKENETINDMYNRFNNNVAGLKGLGMTIGNVELNHRLFHSLPEWWPKVMTIEEAEDLTTTTMEELLGSFITHEHTLHMDKDEMKTSKKMKNDLTLNPHARRG